MANNPFEIDWLGNLKEEKDEFSVVPAQVKTNDELGVKDPLLTSTAFPNILDQFDLPQYTFKLSIKGDNDPKSSDERVIAQTSVTATQIDEVSIRTLSSGMSAGEVTFKLIQPGHVTLMDDINRYRKELGLKLSVRPILFLEVNFKGYTTDYEDNDGGGVPTTIAGPYLYKLFITEIDINITESGSEYNVKTIIHNFYANTNAVTEIPVLTVAIGTNLQDACRKLEEAIKAYNLKEKIQYTVQDQYILNLDDPSLFLDDGRNLKDMHITANLSEALDSTNNDNGDPGIEKIRGADGIEVKDSNLTFQSGVKIDQFFLVMLSMIEGFKRHIARREDGNKPTSAPQPEKTFIKWFRILTDVEEIQDGFDYYRKEYARRYIYTLQIIDTARTDIGQDDERPNTTELVTKRFNDIKERGLLRKAYYHIFTGRNDQIKQLDISFKAGATLLNPPGPTEGTTVKSDLRAQLSNSGLTEEQKTKWIDVNNLRSKALATIRSVTDIPDVVVPLLPGKAQEQARETGNKEAGEYAVAAMQFEKDTGVPFRLYDIDPLESLELERHRIQSLNAPDYVQSGTYFGFSNTLFGFTAYQYHLAALNSSLMSVNMTVRGDPWYLGKKQWTGDTVTELVENRPGGLSTQAAFINPAEGCFYGDHTFFYLQFATPRVSMENYDDEDDDDGYWKFTNKNGELLQSFSGVYLLTSATNTFSNGEYSCELNGILMNEITVSKLPRQSEGGS